MNTENLSQLKIDPAKKRRPCASVKAIFALVSVCVLVAAFYAWPRPNAERRIVGERRNTKASETPGASVTQISKNEPPSTPNLAPATAATPTASARLTVSGYIINRERIELSPRFQGMVKWIGVKKGDPVRKDQVVVLLDDAEQKARVMETEGRLANARVALDRAELSYRRTRDLLAREVISQEAEDQARLTVESAKASIAEIEGQLALARTYLDWTIIRSPIDGVVLEKLAEPGELVSPQSFGGTRGPSTAVLAVADPNDLQVELDINETDLAKITLLQRCLVIPEAYPDKRYDGVVAEISPEANRQKGTLQIKVQIKNPDQFLTPELSAKVEFPP